MAHDAIAAILADMPTLRQAGILMAEAMGEGNVGLCCQRFRCGLIPTIGTEPSGGALENNIVKIVYFDEGSATDYIQIAQGGSLNTIFELVDENASSGGAEAEGKAKIRTKILKTLAGLDVSAGVEGEIETSFSSGSVVKSIISNTVLTDFLAAVSPDDGHDVPITHLSKCRIEQVPGSISSISLFTPYFSMFKSGQGISAGDFDISVDKLDAALAKAKGYLEFLGEREGANDRIILRFNRAAFKNNYRSTDLMKMRLTLYAIHVGSCSLDDLAADNEIKLEGFTSKDNPDYIPRKPAQQIVDKTEELKMYDVLLAGVESSGR